jgi:hypothetical protein
MREERVLTHDRHFNYYKENISHCYLCRLLINYDILHADWKKMKLFFVRLGICYNFKYETVIYSFWVLYEWYTEMVGEKYCEMWVCVKFVLLCFRLKKFGIDRNRKELKRESTNHVSGNMPNSIKILLLHNFILFTLLHKTLTWRKGKFHYR